MSPANELSREAILDAFAVEPDASRDTLERYLRAYPRYAAELVDLSRELNRGPLGDSDPLTAADQALINRAWTVHAAAFPALSASQPSVDPFAALTVDEWRAVATRLDIPRQVVAALRERRVLLSSIPVSFLERFAEMVRSTAADLEASWGTAGFAGARAFKATDKPNAGEQVTLEQVLIEAGVTPEKRARLLGEED